MHGLALQIFSFVSGVITLSPQNVKHVQWAELGLTCQHSKNLRCPD